MAREVRVGEVIAGKYRVEGVLGRGGMGYVVAARHIQLEQRVALKFMTGDAYQHPDAVARFLREARLAVKLQSEHVARVMDVGTMDSGAPYIVMEHLNGHDLKAESERRKLSLTQVVDFALQACEAVAEAHGLGIVHRDLKPSNLFLTRRPDGSALVKVLDFGISKLVDADSSEVSMTATSSIMGSPQYMAPEQIRNAKTVDARADIWALGTILYELLCGKPPFSDETVSGLLAMIVADPTPRGWASRAGVPSQIEEIISRCLEKDRDKRFAQVAELAVALQPFASVEVAPIVSRILRLSGQRPRAAPGSFPAALDPRRASPGIRTGASNWSRTGATSRGRSWKRWALVALVGTAAGVGGYFAWQADVDRSPVVQTARQAVTPVAPARAGTAAGNMLGTNARGANGSGASEPSVGGGKGPTIRPVNATSEPEAPSASDTSAGEGPIGAAGSSGAASTQQGQPASAASSLNNGTRASNVAEPEAGPSPSQSDDASQAGSDENPKFDPALFVGRARNRKSAGRSKARSSRSRSRHSSKASRSSSRSRSSSSSSSRSKSNKPKDTKSDALDLFSDTK